jgi:hypothetical protein
MATLNPSKKALLKLGPIPNLGLDDRAYWYLRRILRDGDDGLG